MDKPRCLVLNPTCLDVVARHADWLAEQPVDVMAEPSFRSLDADGLVQVVREADGIILPATERRWPEAGHMETLTRLKVIAIAASGYDWLDVPAATEHGIVVTYAPIPMGAEVVAEMTWAMMLAVSRQVVMHDRQIRQGNNERGMGVSLMGKTLGIVGLGNIGKAVARRATAFGMTVVATDPQADEGFAAAHAIDILPLDALLGRADAVSLHVRLNDRTRGMIGGEQLARMKPGGYLINTARQELVDEPALVECLKAGHLAGVGLDDPPTDAGAALLAMPNVVLTPHLGNRAIEGVDAVFRSAVRAAAAVLTGNRPEHVVNPEVYDRLRASRS